MYDHVLRNTTSREWQIACRIRELVGKLARKKLDRDEESELQLLQRERVRLMMPKRS